ncbi:hypothetical protein B0J18DRAFT_146613 [Chaetomium sp. MPI-SDFR-AT-0129]|nr:hypothetical protein B0J18DRAFT_146613 [Chaetomium sp. MPI-SDFR-AT-0129]
MASMIENLERTALAVIEALKNMNDSRYSHLRIAVVGGLARMHHNAEDLTTRDVDFIVDTNGLSISEIINAFVRHSPSAFELRIHTPSDLVHGPLDRRLVYNYKLPGGKLEALFVDFIVKGDQCPYFPTAARRVKDIPAGVIPYISLEDLMGFKLWSSHHQETKSESKKDVEGVLHLLDTVAQPLALTQGQRAIVADEISHAMKFVPDDRRDWFREQLGLKPLDPSDDENGQEDAQQHGREGGQDCVQEGTHENNGEQGREDDQGGGQEDRQDGIWEAGEANREDEVEGRDGNGDGDDVNSSLFIRLFLFRYLLLRCGDRMGFND